MGALVWQKTDKMGIGVAFKGNSCYVVARYQPQGNYIGKNLTYVKPLKDAPKIPEPPKPAPTEPVKPVEPVKETLIKPPAMKKDTLLKILPNLYKRFDIKLAFLLSEHKPTNQGWSNLIHFTCGSNCSKIGDRIPAIWFHPGQDKLHIKHCIDDNYNHTFNGSSPLKLGLTKIHMTQKPDANGKWCFSAVVDNNGQKKMYKCHQGTPRDFKNVKVYASDPWYEPADNAHILSLKVETEPETVKEFSVYSDQVVHAISVNGKKYGIKGGNEKKIKLAPGEKIYRVVWGTRDHRMCKLSFYSTNSITYKWKKYGPYGWAIPHNWRTGPHNHYRGGRDKRKTNPYPMHSVRNLPCDWSKTIRMHKSGWPIRFQI